MQTSNIRFFVSAMLFWLFASSAAYSASTPEECLAISGSWESFVNGEEGCWVNMPQQECWGRHGLWNQSRAPTNRPCYLQLSKEQLIAQCRSKGGIWGENGARIEHCYYERIERDCIAKGGEWKREGMNQIFGCLQKADDAGKPCQDGSECQFRRCGYRGPLPPPTEPVTGACAATNNSFGCYAHVHNGKVTGRICVD
jgi:hypothetical protein